MGIDRNARAMMGARIRMDAGLTAATRLVALAALFAPGGMACRTGRCQMHRAALARQAGVCEKTVTRATQALETAGYLHVVPTYGPRRRAEGGRWFRPRGANVLDWVLPPGFFLKDRGSPRAIALGKFG